MDDHYNGNKLLSLKDLDRKDPELRMVWGNRQSGKTFFCKRYMVRRALNHDEPFTAFVRQKKDLANYGQGFWADVGPLAFPGKTMTQKPLLGGSAAELRVDDKMVAQVVPLYDPETIKRNSAMFAVSARGFLDEFISESKYITNEVQKFNSIRASIARGGAKGGHSRLFPVLMCANFVTMYNPYFEYFGVDKHIDSRANFIRGHGWVLEQNFNEAAALSMEENLRTIHGKEMDYMAHNKFLLDNEKFITKLPGQKKPVMNFRHNGRRYGIWYADFVYYVSTVTADGLSHDYTFNMDDHDIGDEMIPKNSDIIKAFKKCYYQNRIVFADGACKNAFLVICDLVEVK